MRDGGGGGGGEGQGAEGVSVILFLTTEKQNFFGVANSIYCSVEGEENG